MYPPELKYTKDHEWVKVKDSTAVVGITSYAQDELGDVVFVQLPDVGSAVKHSEPTGIVESVKAASDLFSPISGKVVAVNQKLFDHPELINQDPYGEGWMIEVEMTDLSELDKLLTSEEYEQSLPTK
jgi:glycine cleavage system H protein